MSRTLQTQLHPSTPVVSPSAVEGIEGNEVDALARLGHDHPAWPVDLIVLSERAWTIVRQLQSCVLPLLGYWDQRIRRCLTAMGELYIDAAGSYRMR